MVNIVRAKFTALVIYIVAMVNIVKAKFAALVISIVAMVNIVVAKLIALRSSDNLRSQIFNPMKRLQNLTLRSELVGGSLR